MATKTEKIDTKTHINIKGANMHNLKNVNVALPKNKLIVVTGVSGSGKSSLAIDTLYAEGQRRYIESLSAYVRQFMGKLQKPDVYSIEGITPAVAITQKVSTSNPRSTIGTTTEIYDFLKLLFTRVGKTFSPISGKQVKRDTPESILEDILKINTKEHIYLMINVQVDKNQTALECLKDLHAAGFTRVEIKDEIQRIDTLIEFDVDYQFSDIDLVIDRFKNEASDENQNRILDSIQTAFSQGGGSCFIKYDDQVKQFSNQFSLDGINFDEPTLNFFSFNNPLGACKKCQGFGNIIDIDPSLVILNDQLSVKDGAVECWKGEKMSFYKDQFIAQAQNFGFPIFRSYSELNEQEKELLWYGNDQVEGIYDFFEMVKTNTYKIQYRVMLSRYRGKTVCPECKGSRLRKETQFVKINGFHIGELITKPVKELREIFSSLKLSKHDQKIADRLLLEINTRLQYIDHVGLNYLSLDRSAASLSGGESQRINLATSLSSSLVGSTYVLDEPSIGLHSKDSEKLIAVLESLRDTGNTVVVVEHDEDIMRKADLIIDMGPEAGNLGGEIVAMGTIDEIAVQKKSLTAQYLNKDIVIQVPHSRRASKHFIEIKGAAANNLKNIDVRFPLNNLVAVTGVSGSGKSSLIKKIVFPGLKKLLNDPIGSVGAHKEITGDVSQIDTVEFIDQNPIGKSSRSNPATYLKIYDDIRQLYSNLSLSKLRGYKSAHFSFNTDGGRCEKCKGEGSITIEMQFMADVTLPCSACDSKKFKEEILEVKYHQKSIFDILDTTINEAILFFKTQEKTEQTPTLKKSLQKIVEKLLPLQKVGLGYVQLGQSSSTLSGGEAQRVKLASFLLETAQKKKTLFIFDEPTTGLHFHDVAKLLTAFDELIKKGHSILLIEHHLDVIKCADYVIDLGLEGGTNGGQLIFEGTPEELVESGLGHTSKYLKEKL